MSLGTGRSPAWSKGTAGRRKCQGGTDNARALKAAWLIPVMAAAAVASAPPAAACACGIAIEADVAYEEGLVVWDGRRETATVKLDLKDAEPRAAVLFPVPAEPRIGQVKSGTDLFGYLEEATRPAAPESGGGEAAQAPGVDVVSRRLIGAFDVAVLRAGDSGALSRWLNENDYRVPAAASPILDRYVRRHWDFVAIKLAKGGEGSLKPLRISFGARKAVYPMELSRASQVPVSLRLYVNSTHAVDGTGIDGMKRVFDSRVDELDPAPPADVRSLLPEPHLTRLELTRASPSAIRADVGIRTASIAPDDGGLPLLAWIGIGIGGVALLGAGLALRRR